MGHGSWVLGCSCTWSFDCQQGMICWSTENQCWSVGLVRVAHTLYYGSENISMTYCTKKHHFMTVCVYRSHFWHFFLFTSLECCGCITKSKCRCDAVWRNILGAVKQGHCCELLALKPIWSPASEFLEGTRHEMAWWFQGFKRYQKPLI